MKSLSVCLVFFLVLIFTTSGSCEVVAGFEPQPPYPSRNCIIVPWKCETAACTSSCKAKWGTNTTGFCNTDNNVCWCKVGSECKPN